MCNYLSAAKAETMVSRCGRQAQGTGSLALVQAVLGAIPGLYRIGLLVLSCLCSSHGTNASQQTISQLTGFKRECENNIRLFRQKLDDDLKGRRLNKTESRKLLNESIKHEEANIRSIDECIQQKLNERRKK